MYDVAIVGLGPAGATLARLLDSSLSVAAIDRKSSEDNSPRKPCGGLLAPDAQRSERLRLSTQGIWLVPMAPTLLFEGSSPGGAKACLAGPRTLPAASYWMTTIRFYWYTIHMARRSGLYLVELWKMANQPGKP